MQEQCETTILNMKAVTLLHLHIHLLTSVSCNTDQFLCGVNIQELLCKWMFYEFKHRISYHDRIL